MKRRLSKNPNKAAKQREDLKRKTIYKRDVERTLYGSQGPAGPVRTLKPEDVEKGK